MGKLDEIREIYNLYTLNGKRACQWWNWIPNNKSIATIKKYITIYEGLDFSLLEHIDKKKDDKLTLDIAMYLIKNVNNHDLQFKLFSEIKCLPTKEKKKAIDESMYCLVCADKFPAFEVFPCCEQAVCERCMFEYISTAINGISFSPIKCMLCKTVYPFKYIKWFLTSRISSWRNTCGYKTMWRTYKTPGVNMLIYKSFFSTPAYGENLYQKFGKMVADMVRCVRILDGDLNGDIESSSLKDFYESELLAEYCSKNVFGLCPCFPLVMNGHINLRNRFAEMVAIDKVCVNDENEEVVLNRGMFKCIICKSREEKLENIEIKKCPHCAVKTIKPNGCNFVICQCNNRWCFICNMRLPNTHEGHNVHFHIKPGTSAYNDDCRISIGGQRKRASGMGFDGPLHVLNACNCRHCSRRAFMSVCSKLDCSNPVDNTKAEDKLLILCKSCNAPDEPYRDSSEDDY